MSRSTDHAALALAAIEATAVPALLDASPAAVVLERLARGGGATNWYLVRSRDDLHRLVVLVRPRSCISFYFDDRLTIGPLDGDARLRMIHFARRDGDAVIAARGKGIELVVDFIASGGELVEFLRENASDVYVFGAYPGRDDDPQAVTLYLPTTTASSGRSRTNPIVGPPF